MTRITAFRIKILLTEKENMIMKKRIIAGVMTAGMIFTVGCSPKIETTGITIDSFMDDMLNKDLNQFVNLENLADNAETKEGKGGISQYTSEADLEYDGTRVGDMSIPKLIAGTVIVENIFAWPGVGRVCVDAIFNRDFPVIQAYILLMAVLFVICNLLVDIFSVTIDPRMRKE